MMPNFAILVYTTGIWDPMSGEPKPESRNFLRWAIDPEREQHYQKLWMQQNTIRPHLGSPDAPIVCVRGNHDFTDLAPWFGGEVYEIQQPTDVFVLHGLRIGGKRGIPRIYGTWSGEEQPEESLEQAKLIPEDLDILVTHPPPHQVLDFVPQGDGYVGCRGLRRYLDRQIYGRQTLKLHCFGHIHESRGTAQEYGITFSNAATTYVEIEIGETDDDEGTAVQANYRATELRGLR